MINDHILSIFYIFSVLPKQIIPSVAVADEASFLPQWAVAVIVIGLGSLLFVVLFGITVVSIYI